MNTARQWLPGCASGACPLGRGVDAFSPAGSSLSSERPSVGGWSCTPEDPRLYQGQRYVSDTAVLPWIWYSKVVYDFST